MLKNFQNIASFAQLQFKSMNICLFSTKLPISVNISGTVIEILTFNKLSSKVYVSRSVRSMKMTLTPVSTTHHACETVEMLSQDI